MKISFIIPVYNCKAFLTDCVSSIRSTNIQDYEIILVDDGSTDGSSALCDELATIYSEVRAVHQPNTGVSAARNRGIRESTGELILFMDADDSIEPKLLSKVLSDSRCAESDLTIFGLTFDYYKNGYCYRRDTLFYAVNEVLNPETWGENFLTLFEKNSLSPVWNKIYRKDILQQYNLLFNEEMFLYEDLEFVLRYMQHCDKIWNVPNAIYHYRQSENEGNAKRRLMRVDSLPFFLKPIEKALKVLPKSVSEEARAAVLQQIYIFLARDKIIISDLKGIRKVCSDFCFWTKGRYMPLKMDLFQRRLLQQKTVLLYIASRKTQIRHRLAVKVKAAYRKMNALRD